MSLEYPGYNLATPKFIVWRDCHKFKVWRVVYRSSSSPEVSRPNPSITQQFDAMPRQYSQLMPATAIYSKRLSPQIPHAEVVTEPRTPIKVDSVAVIAWTSGDM